MGKTIINTDRTQKTSTATYVTEPTSRKVLSRYLRGPTSSCHDNCKHGTKQTTETKPTNLVPRRSLSLNVSNSVQTIKKVPPPVPKPTTRDFKNNNNNVFKNDVLKKEVFKYSIKKDRQDLKPKRVNSQDKTCYLPSSRTPNRRHSDVFLSNNDMSLSASRIPKRRLSEVFVCPNRDLGSRKNELRKDSKLCLVNKKCNSVKTSVSISSPKKSVKAPTLRTQNSLTKPELKVSRKSKPVKHVEEFVPEKNLYVVEFKNGEETNKSESLIGLMVSLSSMEDDSDNPVTEGQNNDNVEDSGAKNTLQVSSSSMEDDTHVTEGQNNDKLVDSEAKNSLQVAPSSMEDDTHEKEGKNNDNVVDSGVKNTLQVSSSSMEDDTHGKEGKNNDNVADSGVKNTLQVSSSSMEDDTHGKEGKNNDNVADSGVKNTLQVSSSSMEDDTHEKECKNDDNVADSGVKNTLQVASSSMEDNTHVTKCQNNDNVEDSGVNNTKKATLMVETEDLSPGKLKFRRGKVIDPQFEGTSPRKLKFREAKVLDKSETKVDNNKSLRRVESDAVERVLESNSVSVELKHQEMEEKKDPKGLINNVIEETASKLIQTRKSKVKALVGAFENVFSSGNDMKIFDNRSSKLL